MAKLDIVFYPEPVLRRRAEEVTDIDGEVARLLDDMAETMYAAHGVGLAAPQIGVGRRVITVDVERGDDGGPGRLYQLVNPVVVEGHGKILYEEGCLSFPGLTVEVPRYETVLVRALDRHGEPIEIDADGLLSICLQHEIDHIDGITFIDRLSGLRRQLARRRWRRIAAELLGSEEAA